MDKSSLIPIGRFARLTDLTPRLLRKLDDRGLLSPVYVDPDTRYRYYEAGQMRRAGLIHLCRQLDLSASETRELLAAVDQGDLRVHLERQRERVEVRLAEQSRLLGLLEQELARGEQPLDYEIALRDEPATLVASASGVLRRTHPHDPWALEAALRRVAGSAAEQLARHGEVPDPHPIILYHSDFEFDDEMRFEVCFPVPRVLPESPGMRCRELPAARLAFTTFRGAYDTIWNVHLELEVWATEHGLAPVGSKRERGIVDETDTADPRQWVTEVALEVASGE